MSNKQLSSKDQEVKAPFNSSDLDLSENRLLDDTPRHKRSDLIEKIAVKPDEQRRIFLGNFTEHKPPKGFSVELSPDPTSADAVLTEVTSLGTPSRYKLMLHIANFGTKTVTAEVWQL